MAERAGTCGRSRLQVRSDPMWSNLRADETHNPPGLQDKRTPSSSRWAGRGEASPPRTIAANGQRQTVAGVETGARSTKASFKGSGGEELAARLDLPAGRPTAFAVFAHCFTCSKDLAAASRIAGGLVEQGLGVLRFDFTGLGSSEGEFANTNFSSNVEDLVRAAAWVRDSHEPPRLLVGHSLGGAAILAAATQLPEVTAVATIGAPFDPSHLVHLFPSDVLSRLEQEGHADVRLAGRSFRIRRQLLDDICGVRMADHISHLRRALLVLHSPRDELVDVDHARRIFEAAHHPKSFVSLDDADHLLTNRRDADYVASVLGAWTRHYLPTYDTSLGTTAAAARVEGDVEVAESGRGRFAQVVRAGQHTLAADEPRKIGDDTGPTPYDLLLAALGACTSMTLRMYADRQGWPLEHVSVRLAHHRVHAADCGQPNDKPCRVDHIERSLTLLGPLTDKQRSQLVEIAGRCPVHATLTGDPRRPRGVGSRRPSRRKVHDSRHHGRRVDSERRRMLRLRHS